MTETRQVGPTKKPPHFATLLLMSLAPSEIGKRIADRRAELGWTHERLAREMDVGLRTVQRWQKGVDPKTGKSWLPRLGTLMDLADVMQVEHSYFVEDRHDQPDILARLQAIEDEGRETQDLIARGFAALGVTLPLRELQRLDGDAQAASETS
jgi:transcriptional regulator with XRE-family HTH domain